MRTQTGTLDRRPMFTPSTLYDFGKHIIQYRDDSRNSYIIWATCRSVSWICFVHTGAIIQRNDYNIRFISIYVIGVLSSFYKSCFKIQLILLTNNKCNFTNYISLKIITNFLQLQFYYLNSYSSTHRPNTRFFCNN